MGIPQDKDRMWGDHGSRVSLPVWLGSFMAFDG